MTFISYAQNYEDVMLHRALSDVERGFYVDVGAQDPIDDSVTKAFHALGWRGINVEPVARWHARLLEDRPHDVNLRMIAASKAGSATFHDVADSGLSTTDAALAQSHADAGRSVSTYVVECRTLDSILAEHAAPEIHFLKIDVEGAEADVLRGLSLERFRPWILVIEARAPNSTAETYAEWEPGILSARYRFVYDDGLNRFYLAQEQAPRARHFASPPNFWDDFIRAPEWRAREEAARMRSEWSLIETGQRIGELSHGLTRALADAEGMQQQVSALSSQNAALTAERVHAQQRAAELSEALASSQRRADGLSQELATSQRRTEELAEELASVHRRADALAERIHGLEQALHAADERQRGLDAELVARESALHFQRDAHDALQAQYDSLLASKSWQLTRPIRVLRRLFANGPGEVLGYLTRRRRRDPEPAAEGAASTATDPAVAQLASPQETLARTALAEAWQEKQTRSAR